MVRAEDMFDAVADLKEVAKPSEVSPPDAPLCPRDPFFLSFEGLPRHTSSPTLAARLAAGDCRCLETKAFSGQLLAALQDVNSAEIKKCLGADARRTSEMTTSTADVSDDDKDISDDDAADVCGVSGTEETGSGMPKFSTAGITNDHEDREPYVIPRAMNESETRDGSRAWTQRLSVELQQVVDTFNVDELTNLNFSVTVADPTQPGCPIVAMSEGFAELSGYSMEDIVGKNCRFMLDGVPPHLIEQETRDKCRAFCQTVGGMDCQFDDAVPQDLKKSRPTGELMCIQTNARKTGELFRNMFHLKFVELDDKPCILGLQVGMVGSLETQDQVTAIDKACQTALDTLVLNMKTIEQVLAAQFWYSAPMTRQAWGG